MQKVWSLRDLRQSKASREIIGGVLKVLETLRILPKGISQAQRVLRIAAGRRVWDFYSYVFGGFG